MRPRMLIVSLLAVLVLVGCTDDPEPKIEAKPTPTTAPTSASPSAPAASGTESPEEFIRRWFEAGFELQSKNDPQMFQSLSDNKCGPCNDLVDSVASYYNNGGFVRPAEIKILKVSRPPNSRLDFAVETTSGVTTVKESATAAEKMLAGGTVTYLARLAPRGESWSMQTFFLEPTA